MATQPCPCGRLDDPAGSCSCTPLQIQKYVSKVSGPLLDRIDIHVDVPAVRYRELTDEPLGETSAVIRERVVRARKIQQLRFGERSNAVCNADMTTSEVRRYCRPDSRGEALLRMAMIKLGLSARGYHRVLKVARTISDLAGSGEILADHLAEAVQYRKVDRSPDQT